MDEHDIISNEDIDLDFLNLVFWKFNCIDSRFAKAVIKEIKKKNSLVLWKIV